MIDPVIFTHVIPAGCIAACAWAGVIIVKNVRLILEARREEVTFASAPVLVGEWPVAPSGLTDTDKELLDRQALVRRQTRLKLRKARLEHDLEAAIANHKPRRSIKQELVRVEEDISLLTAEFMTGLFREATAELGRQA